MSPRSKEDFAKIRSESRKAIVDAAMTLFARKGVSDTTMADIAKKAGISKGLIYNYFPGKLDILDFLVTEVVHYRLPMLLKIPESAEAQRHIESLIRAWIHLIKTEPELMRLFNEIHLNGHLAKLLLRRHAKLYEEMVESFFGIFRKLKSPDPLSDAFLLGALFDGISLNYTAAPSVYPIEKMEKRLLAMFTYTKD